MKTIIGKFDNPSFWNYVEAHFVANKTDRRILSSELHSQAILCVDTLKTHSHTRNVFSGDVHYQEPFEVDIVVSTSIDISYSLICICMHFNKCARRTA